MDSKKPQKHKIAKHGLIMLLCCLIPIVILVILLAVGLRGSYMYFAIILLCPLLHIIMMMSMHKKDGDSIDHDH